MSVAAIKKISIKQEFIKANDDYTVVMYIKDTGSGRSQ